MKLKCLILTVLISLIGCSNEQQSEQIGFVTNGVGSFWVIASKCVEHAAKEFSVQTAVDMPAEGVSDQKRIIQTLLARGIDGIAVSPIDPENQTDLLNEAAANTFLITHDSDAPNSNRLCFIGIDNY